MRVTYFIVTILFANLSNAKNTPLSATFKEVKEDGDKEEVTKKATTSDSASGRFGNGYLPGPIVDPYYYVPLPPLPPLHPLPLPLPLPPRYDDDYLLDDYDDGYDYGEGYDDDDEGYDYGGKGGGKRGGGKRGGGNRGGGNRRGGNRRGGNRRGGNRRGGNRRGGNRRGGNRRGGNRRGGHRNLAESKTGTEEGIQK